MKSESNVVYTKCTKAKQNMKINSTNEKQIQ